MLYFFFFKQKTAYEMRISDWSSDVCSSDLSLRNPLPPLGGEGYRKTTLSPRRAGLSHMGKEFEEELFVPVGFAHLACHWLVEGMGAQDVLGEASDEIGRASCRARVCQYV